MSSAENTKKGKVGEQLAVDFFLREGYSICCRNFRYGRAEIDLIAKKDDLLVFVEVKLRKSTLYGLPEESINEKKIGLIQLAANEFIYDMKWEGPVRFDVICILEMGGRREYVHVKDAF
jgi:putative endonuclease